MRGYPTGFTCAEGRYTSKLDGSKGQFGGGFDSMRHFRQTFGENLRLALAVYRDARVEMTERGVDLPPRGRRLLPE